MVVLVCSHVSLRMGKKALNPYLYFPIDDVTQCVCACTCVYGYVCLCVGTGMNCYSFAYYEWVCICFNGWLFCSRFAITNDLLSRFIENHTGYWRFLIRLSFCAIFMLRIEFGKIEGKSEEEIVHKWDPIRWLWKHDGPILVAEWLREQWFPFTYMWSRCSPVSHYEYELWLEVSSTNL